MRILIVNWRDIKHPEAGGAELHIHEIAKRWRKQGHEIVLLCGSYAGAPSHEMIDGIQIIRRGNRYTVYPGAAAEYLRQKVKCDVIFESVNTVPFCTPLYSCVPTVSLIYQYTPLRLLLQETAIPFALCAAASQTLIPLLYKKGGIITISESSKLELERHGTPSHRVSVVRPGISYSLYARKDPKRKPFSKNVIYLGRLKRYKGILTLIKAFQGIARFHEDVRLYVVGRGDLLPKIVELTKSLGLEGKVLMTGYVDEKAKISMLCRSSIVVYPGEHFDGGWSISVAEAMALGAVPVVSTNLKDMVTESGAGLIHPPGDYVTLGEELLRLIEDEGLWRQMSLRASIWARSFSWDRTAKETFDAITSFVNSSC